MPCQSAAEASCAHLSPVGMPGSVGVAGGVTSTAWIVAGCDGGDSDGRVAERRTDVTASWASAFGDAGVGRGPNPLSATAARYAGNQEIASPTDGQAAMVVI